MATIDMETGSHGLQKPGVGPVGPLRAAAALTGAYVASDPGACGGGTHVRLWITLAAGTVAATGGVQLQVEETETDPDGAPTWRPVTRYDSAANQYLVHSPQLLADGEWSIAVPRSSRYVRVKLKGIAAGGGSATVQARAESLGAQ